MPSDTFYGFVGGIGGFLLIAGATAMMSDYGQEGNKILHLAAPFMFLATLPFFITIGIGIFYDLRPKFREWNIERKSEEMRLRGEERELEKKKHKMEISKDTVEYDKNIRQKESPKPSQVQDYQKQTNGTPTQTSDTLPKQTTNPMGTKQDESILTTRGDVPEKLKRETDTIEQIKKEPHIQKQETEYIDEDYKRAISMDAHMKCLWALSKAPNHSFPNKQKLILDAQGHDGDRSEYYKAINDLISSGLVHILDKRKYADEKRSTGRPELTKIGTELAQIARDKKIVQWNNFVETFKDRLS